jgi:hypothetical protein
LNEKLDFRIQVAPCVITGQFEKVITVHLGQVNFQLDNGEAGACEVHGQFSEDGLEMMLRALRTAPLPVPAEVLEPPTEVRAKMSYQWRVTYRDETILWQFPREGPELHLGAVDLHQVVELALLPKDLNADLPWFKLDRLAGFFVRRTQLHAWERLDLPMPLAPLHLEYQRRVTQSWGAGPLVTPQAYPRQVRHELGWRVDTLHGDAEETICLIGIEDDNGSWQVLKQEPTGSRHLAPRQIYAETRLVGMAIDG